MERGEVERRVIDTIERVSAELGFPREHISLETSLIDQIGLDSLRFVELTVGLEDALGLKVFPMQDWADQQLAVEQGSPRFLVRHLVEACARILAEERRLPGHQTP